MLMQPPTHSLLAHPNPKHNKIRIRNIKVQNVRNKVGYNDERFLCNRQCHVLLQQLVELAACRRGHLRNCEKFTKVRPCSSIYNSSWVGVVFNQGCCLPRRCSRSSPCPANITPTLINLCTECARLLQEARGHTAAMLFVDVSHQEVPQFKKKVNV